MDRNELEAELMSLSAMRAAKCAELQAATRRADASETARLENEVNNIDSQLASMNAEIDELDDDEEDEDMIFGAGTFGSGAFSSAFGGGFDAATLRTAPTILLQAVIECGDKTKEGILVTAIAVPWFEIIRLLKKDPEMAFKIDWRKWEEIIAGAYKQAGFDDVILTPRSNDKGRDVIATKRGVGSIRFFDQVKAYNPKHLVDADEVRAMLGVLTRDQNVSKGIVTTTSSFAPGVYDEFRQIMPHRLELKSGDVLIPWLIELAEGKT